MTLVSIIMYLSLPLSGPPMPWQMYRIMTDEDLKAVFTYLQSLPPQKNLVPPPVSPEQLEAM